MNVRRLVSPLLLLMLAGAFAGPASASLTEFKTFIGNVGYSSDGFASTNQSGTISAKVPAGSTVLAAYLYTGTFDTSPTTGDGTTLNGNVVSFGAPIVNSDACCTNASRRADVTSIIKPVIDGGAGGVYDFSVAETAGNQDGEALVVVYSNPSLPQSTFAILDGFAATVGDTTSINFADPLDPTQPGFFAEMFLGDEFSFDGDCSGSGQVSTVKVNGADITNNAGCNDDSIDASAANGNLMTVGGFDDGFSPPLPTTAEDHERYNLVPEIKMGDTSIVVDTVNASRDDNIFLAGFYVTGVAGINQPPPTGVPEPSNLALFGIGVLGLWLLKRRFNPLARR